MQYRLSIAILVAGATFRLFPLSPAIGADSLSYDELAQFSATQHKLHPEAPELLKLAEQKLGRRARYAVTKINELNAVALPAGKATVGAEDFPTALKPRPRDGWDVVTYALLHPKLRQDHTDILPAEDPTQQSLAAGKFNDLKGASLSYTWDAKAHTDTWSAQAALIVPMIWNGNLNYGLKPIYYGIVPSVSLNRITTNGDPANETDSLIYRGGVFGQWLLAGSPGGHFHARVNFTGSFAYATDTHGDLQLPAGEFDLEPQIFSNPSLSLGYIGEIFYDRSRPYDDPKRVTAGYQLRVWLHGEYGSVQQTSAHIALEQEDFFRLGPVAQFRLIFPTFFDGLTLSAEYHYLPTLSGFGGKDGLFKAGAELTLLDKSETGGPRLSLDVNYINGGLDLTKDEVDTLTVGLGLLF